MNEEVSPPRGCLIVWCGVALMLIGLALVLPRSFAAQPKSGLAPDFTLSTYDGQTITLSELRGHIVVINFWASWCDHCADESAAFEKAWQAYHDQDVTFIGVGCDDTDAAGRKFVEQHGITYPNGPDPAGHISDAYAIQGLPETFFIDRQGEIMFIAMSALSYEELSAEVERLRSR